MQQHTVQITFSFRQHTHAKAYMMFGKPFFFVSYDMCTDSYFGIWYISVSHCGDAVVHAQ